ncbi:MAG: type II toxin-antitoxin system VapC family toxin [Geodermatophilaceae bacterium]
MTAAVRGGLIVDTSAAVAIVLDEPGSADLIAALDGADPRLMSTAIRVEFGLVIEARLGPSGADAVNRFLREAQIEIVDVDVETSERALGGWRRYGKGRHRAGLNYGDCFTYALAERTGLPVLCVGDDFTATDLDVRRPSLPAQGRQGAGSDR